MPEINEMSGHPQMTTQPPITELPEYTSEQLKAFDDLPSGVMINVDDGRGGLKYAYSNPFLARSLGYTHEEFQQTLRTNCFAAIYDADRQKTVNARSKVRAGEIVDSITRQKKKDGSFVWILAHIRRIRLDGKVGMLFLFSRIQDLIGLQNELTAKNKTWTDILQSVPIGLLVYREENGVRTTLSVNRFLLDLANATGAQLDTRKRTWTEAELSMIFNQNIYTFCAQEDIPLVEKMLKDSETESFSECTFRVHGSDPEFPIFIHAACASKETEGNSRTYYVTYLDVTEEENRRIELAQKQEQLYRLSYYDALTGVKNRNAYNEYVEVCRNESISNAGIVFCDINGLKKTNDSLGHLYGDQLIQHFTALLKAYFDPDMIYRLSGDEFVVICPDTDRDAFQARMEELIRDAADEDHIASIGYIWREKVSDVQRRVTRAEQIMYVEKQQYYEITRTVNSKHRPPMLEALLKDFDDGRYLCFLQPKTSIDGTRIIGAEALARKTDDLGRIHLPYEFVPQLEFERLIPKLDFFMLEESCRFLQEQHRIGNDAFSVSVNVSRVTIMENNYLQTVRSVLERYDFDRSNLEMELTESNKTMDDVRLEECLAGLKALGVKVSLDDMGNDYSTLSLLTMDGFDWVKLDRSLIIQLNQSKARVLVKHIINTCHDLNLKVIAEGVETEDIRLVLREMNCDAYQGFLKSRPIPLEDFRERFL